MIKGNLALETSPVPVWQKRITPSTIFRSGQKAKSKTAAFAEAVILQSIEDLFDSLQRKDSIDFFKGEGFRLYAKIAGLSATDQIRIIRMLANAGFKQ
ncbi:MAG: hypothetical protein WAV13_01200 [Thermodesulfovibrionales bacterium]